MQAFRDHAVQYAYPLLLAGLAVAALGALWLVLRAIRDYRWWMIFAPVTLPVYLVQRTRRAVAPLAVIAVGLLVAAAPAAIDRLIPIDLGPRDKIVDGERHLTLTGLDRTDYADYLRQKPDTVVLQMANADVTDDTLALLADMTRLRRLDISHSQVTDDGLWRLTALPALRELYLTGTKVTDKGVREALAPHPALKMLDVRQTAVTAAAVSEWRKAQPGRRALR
jgi:Leucine Rich repeat